MVELVFWSDDVSRFLLFNWTTEAKYLVLWGESEDEGADAEDCSRENGWRLWEREVGDVR